MTRTQKIILLLIAVFSLTVLVVTAVNLTTKNAIPAKNLRKADPSYESILKKSKKDGTPSNIYTSLGSLRCITADAVTVIISPYFSYQKEDIAFFEELSSKNKKLQQITIQYVKTHTYNELIDKDELIIKNELLTLFNDTLIMGKISILYFEEYIFFE